MGIDITAYDIAMRYVGLGELPGIKDHPFIQHCFLLCGLGLETPDETPWCSAFAQHPAWELRLPRSKSARARSWLTIGRSVGLGEAKVGFDVVILKRGPDPQPGPDVIEAPGHVGYFGGLELSKVLVLAGNQGDKVSLAYFPASDVIGVRRLLD